MLKSQKRLHNNKDFINVFQHGNRYFSNGILLSYCFNDLKHSRIGFIVSKKYSPLAVHRNRQRRILQSAVHSLYPKIKPGFDIIISYTNHNKVLPYKDTLDILTKIFSKTNLFYN